jgi:hypothetical protein
MNRDGKDHGCEWPTERLRTPENSAGTHDTQGVTGSSPVRPTDFLQITLVMVRVDSLPCRLVSKSVSSLKCGFKLPNRRQRSPTGDLIRGIVNDVHATGKDAVGLLLPSTKECRICVPAASAAFLRTSGPSACHRLLVGFS